MPPHLHTKHHTTKDTRVRLLFTLKVPRGAYTNATTRPSAWELGTSDTTVSCRQYKHKWDRTMFDNTNKNFENYNTNEMLYKN